MWEREQIASSYLGNFVAMPHGTDESRKFVNFGQIVFLRFAHPFMWDDEEVKLCIGIAAQGDEHVEIIGNLADALLDEEKFEKLLSTNEHDDVLKILSPTGL
jgi:mannitol/fructose-specific phosphotransferase system IIA component